MLQTSTFDVSIGTVNFLVQVDWTRRDDDSGVYRFDDGTGCPDGPPSVDSIDSVKCLHCTFPTIYSEDEVRCCIEDGYGHAFPDDYPGAFNVAERWIGASICAGDYDSELFEFATDRG